MMMCDGFYSIAVSRMFECRGLAKVLALLRTDFLFSMSSRLEPLS